MKKILTVFLALALMFSVTACGKKNEEAEATLPSTTQSTAPSTTQSTSPTTTAAPTEPEAEFEEIVLVETDAVTVKITGVEQDPIWGYTLKAFVENKSDKELMFTVQNVSVNGFMCDPYWAVSVDAGKKSNSTISWLDTAFAENGIETVEEITFTLRAYDSNDWLAEDVINETFTVNL